MLGACGAPTAMLGPAYTFTTTGNIAQAGLSYGSDHLITSYTGKSTIENIEDITSKNLPVKKNIQKQTLQSEDFYHKKSTCVYFSNCSQSSFFDLNL